MNATFTATLRLLGDPVLERGGSAKALERRAAGLLALVVLSPGVTRARAAALLWPDSDQPRQALRQQLLRFRKHYGLALLQGDDVLALADGVAVDLHDDAATGELLADLDFADCADFAAWLAQQRDERRSRAAARVARRLEAAEAQGDLDTALALAGQLLQADDDAEAHHRTLMRLHYLRGDVAQAQAAYERLQRQLAQRYGAHPAPETEALARTLRSALAAPPAPPRAVPVAVLRPPRLIGRQRERAALEAAWLQGRAALLLGEPGLGKSRLLAEFAAGRPVVGVQGRPGDAGVPYATLSRLLRTLLQSHPLELPAPRRTELARLLPELAPALPLPADGQRLLLQGAVEAVLAQVPASGVVVDDLHFADAASVEMLQALMGAGSPLRWVLAQRPGEGSAAAAALRATLEEAQALDTVALAPLSAEEMAALIDSLSLPELDSAQLAAPLARHTGGNPLYALETLKQGLAGGLLQQGRLPSPLNVGALIERRLKQLPERALALARVAAIAGVDFGIALAEHVMGLQAVDLADPWAELEAAQVLRDDAFAHDLVYEAALRSVPAPVARRLHAQCAAWLAARGGEPGRVAEHWWQGGEPARAAQAFIAAAQRAEAAGRTDDKAALLLRAADAFGAAGQPDARFDALCERAGSLRDLDLGPRGLDEARALVAAAASDAQRLRAQQMLVGLLAERGESEATIETGRPAIALAERLGERAVAVRLACNVASAMGRLGQVHETVALLRPLQAWVDAQPDPALTMLWYGDWAAALGRAGRMREALAGYETAIAAARRAQLRDPEGRLVMNCAVTLRQSGRFDRALAMARQARALTADDATNATNGLIAQLVIARDESETGHYESALAALEPLVPAFESAGAGFWAQAARLVLVQLWLHLGQFARAVPLLGAEPDGMPAWLRVDRALLQRELALALCQPTADAALAGTLALTATDPFRHPAMQVRALHGAAPAQVLAQAAALHDTLRAQERLGVLMALQVHEAHAALALGRVPQAAAAADAVLAHFDDGIAPDSMYRPQAWWVAHRALQAAGRAAAAEHALQQGRQWVRQHALPHVPTPFIESFLKRNAVNAALLA